MLGQVLDVFEVVGRCYQCHMQFLWFSLHPSIKSGMINSTILVGRLAIRRQDQQAILFAKFTPVGCQNRVQRLHDWSEAAREQKG